MLQLATVSAKKAWLLFTALRLLFFVIPFAVFYLLIPKPEYGGITWGIFLAAVGAGLVSFALSLLFLSDLRERAAQGLSQWGARDKPTEAAQADADLEDAALDSAGHHQSQPMLRRNPDGGISRVDDE